MGVGFLACGFVGTCLSWILIIHVGRRRIYICGLAMLATLQFIIGILDCVPGYEQKSGLSWAQAVLMLIWNFIYGWSVGPICFVIICEASATRVRSKTIGIATAAQATMGIVMTVSYLRANPRSGLIIHTSQVAIPYMINPDEANLRGKLGFFFGGLATVSWVWAYLRVPEFKGKPRNLAKTSAILLLSPSGRTYEELDTMFERNVPTKAFKTYVVER
jgi:MFS transporter, SP family, general alpha glucoside:H+ symporter